MTLDPCQLLSSQLGELFQCSRTPRGHVRVRTPLMYPDGGLIDVFILEQQDRLQLTDFGEALGWLRQQTATGRLSPKQRKLIGDVVLTLGVELFRGQIIARCEDPAGLSDALLRVAQACLRSGDLWFTTRTRAVETTTDEIADWLDDHHISYERGVSLPGRSGRIWGLEFQTRTSSRSTLVSVLSSGSTAAARRVSEHTLATWHDLSHLRVGPSGLTFVSLFDDTSDVWTPEDFKLVESLSDVCFWSQPDVLSNILTAA